MARIKDRQFWESGKYNTQAHMQYYNRLTELSISMFDWKNLPDTVDERFMELTLFGDGMAVFFYDDVMGFLCLRTMIGGHLDIYQIPTERTAYASNGYNMHLDNTNSVIIFNNMIHTPSSQLVDVYSRRLWELDRTIDINAKAQRTPILISCDEQQRLTLKNLYMKYDGGEPVIYGDKNLNPNSIKVLTTGAPYICDKLNQLKTQIWNEALTYLGISNINIQKKERMISDEVVRNQGGIIASRYSRLESRRQACDKINKMFNLDIWCDFREDYREADDETIFDLATGGKDNLAQDMVIDLRTK